MQYALPDGRTVDLENVIRVSKIRDIGADASSIEYSKLSFLIHLRTEAVIEVTEQYHYADWSEKKTKLSKLRNDMVNKWKEVTGKTDDE